MRTIQQIEQQLLAALQPLEKKRALTKRKLQDSLVLATLLTLLLVGIGAAGYLYLINNLDPTTSFAKGLQIIAILIFLSGLLVYKPFVNKRTAIVETFELEVKETVYHQIFTTWNPTITYQPQHLLSQKVFARSQLYPLGNGYEGDDYCEGKLKDGRSFRFSELWVYQGSPKERAENSSSLKTHFKGLFIVLEDSALLPNQKGSFIIRPQSHKALEQRARQRLSKQQLLQRLSNGQPPLQTDLLDDGLLQANKEAAPLPLFDQLYEVSNATTTDSSTLLSEEFRQELNLRRTKQRQSISLSFINNTAYIGLSQQLDLWTVAINHSLVRPEWLRQLAHNFHATFELLESLARIIPVHLPTGK